MIFDVRVKYMRLDEPSPPGPLVIVKESRTFSSFLEFFFLLDANVFSELPTLNPPTPARILAGHKSRSFLFLLTIGAASYLKVQPPTFFPFLT